MERRAAHARQVPLSMGRRGLAVGGGRGADGQEPDRNFKLEERIKDIHISNKYIYILMFFVQNIFENILSKYLL